VKLAVTLLTGNRLALFRQTVDSVLRMEPSLLLDAHVTVRVNPADDTATRNYVGSLGWVDRIFGEASAQRAVARIGPAVSSMMATVPETAKYVLHLEDDWCCTDSGWLDDAVTILERDERIGQVRLRERAEPVLPKHSVTGDTIAWRSRKIDSLMYQHGQAHFTFNPSLIRRAQLDAIYPCRHEEHAQTRFLGTGLKVAQLIPGAFVHTGDGPQSLRDRLGRSR
jgi:hypothetical protein